MKRKMFLLMTAILAVGLLFIGCPTEPPKQPPKPPNYGTNLVTEAAILAATGHGSTEVEKVEEGVYTVTGNVAEFVKWSDDAGAQVPNGEYGIELNIPADPTNSDAFFSQANRYGIKITFSDSSVKPINEYTDGFRIYLENTKATANTAQWGGTWKHEYVEEYNAIGGVGTMTINRDLAKPEESDEVGDYQNLVLVLKFDDTHDGQQYTFTISNVAVYGAEVSSNVLKETPTIMDDPDYTNLDDAVYLKDDTATALKVLANWTANRDTYTHQWYSNTTNSNTGGSEISTETNQSFTPPTDTEGVTYYYVVITYPTDATSVASKAVKITVLPADTLILGDFTYTNSEAQKGWDLKDDDWTAFEDASFLVVETFIVEETYGFGGLQVILQGAPDTSDPPVNVPNWATTETASWTSYTRANKTVYVVVDLSVLTDYSTFISSGSGGKLILGVYPALSGLGFQNAYLTASALTKGATPDADYPIKPATEGDPSPGNLGWITDVFPF